MIDMRMRQDHRVNRVRREREITIVQFALGFRALHHAAINQHLLVAGFDQETGSRDSPTSSVKVQTHLNPFNNIISQGLMMSG